MKKTWLLTGLLLLLSCLKSSPVAAQTTDTNQAIIEQLRQTYPDLSDAELEAIVGQTVQDISANNVGLTDEALRRLATQTASAYIRTQLINPQILPHRSDNSLIDQVMEEFRQKYPNVSETTLRQLAAQNGNNFQTAVNRVNAILGQMTKTAADNITPKIAVEAAVRYGTVAEAAEAADWIITEVFWPNYNRLQSDNYAPQLLLGQLVFNNLWASDPLAQTRTDYGTAMSFASELVSYRNISEDAARVIAVFNLGELSEAGGRDTNLRQALFDADQLNTTLTKLTAYVSQDTARELVGGLDVVGELSYIATDLAGLTNRISGMTGSRAGRDLDPRAAELLAVMNLFTPSQFSDQAQKALERGGSLQAKLNETGCSEEGDVCCHPQWCGRVSPGVAQILSIFSINIPTTTDINGDIVVPSTLLSSATHYITAYDQVNEELRKVGLGLSETEIENSAVAGRNNPDEAVEIAEGKALEEQVNRYDNIPEETSGDDGIPEEEEELTGAEAARAQVLADPYTKTSGSGELAKRIIGQAQMSSPVGLAMQVLDGSLKVDDSGEEGESGGGSSLRLDKDGLLNLSAKLPNVSSQTIINLATKYGGDKGKALAGIAQTVTELKGSLSDAQAGSVPINVLTKIATQYAGNTSGATSAIVAQYLPVINKLQSSEAGSSMPDIILSQIAYRNLDSANANSAALSDLGHVISLGQSLKNSTGISDQAAQILAVFHLDDISTAYNDAQSIPALAQKYADRLGISPETAQVVAALGKTGELDYLTQNGTGSSFEQLLTDDVKTTLTNQVMSRVGLDNTQGQQILTAINSLSGQESIIKTADTTKLTNLANTVSSALGGGSSTTQVLAALEVIGDVSSTGQTVTSKESIKAVALEEVVSKYGLSTSQSQQISGVVDTILNSGSGSLTKTDGSQLKEIISSLSTNLRGDAGGGREVQAALQLLDSFQEKSLNLDALKSSLGGVLGRFSLHEQTPAPYPALAQALIVRAAAADPDPTPTDPSPTEQSNKETASLLSLFQSKIKENINQDTIKQKVTNWVSSNASRQTNGLITKEVFEELKTDFPAASEKALWNMLEKKAGNKAAAAGDIRQTYEDLTAYLRGDSTDADIPVNIVAKLAADYGGDSGQAISKAVNEYWPTYKQIQNEGLSDEALSEIAYQQMSNVDLGGVSGDRALDYYIGLRDGTLTTDDILEENLDNIAIGNYTARDLQDAITVYNAIQSGETTDEDVANENWDQINIGGTKGTDIKNGINLYNAIKRGTVTYDDVAEYGDKVKIGQYTGRDVLKLSQAIQTDGASSVASQILASHGYDGSVESLFYNTSAGKKVATALGKSTGMSPEAAEILSASDMTGDLSSVADNELTLKGTFDGIVEGSDWGGLGTNVGQIFTAGNIFQAAKAISSVAGVLNLQGGATAKTMARHLTFEGYEVYHTDSQSNYHYLQALHRHNDVEFDDATVPLLRNANYVPERLNSAETYYGYAAHTDVNPDADILTESAWITKMSLPVSCMMKTSNLAYIINTCDLHQSPHCDALYKGSDGLEKIRNSRLTIKQLAYLSLYAILNHDDPAATDTVASLTTNLAAAYQQNDATAIAAAQQALNEFITRVRKDFLGITEGADAASIVGTALAVDLANNQSLYDHRMDYCQDLYSVDTQATNEATLLADPQTDTTQKGQVLLSWAMSNLDFYLINQYRTGYVVQVNRICEVASKPLCRQPLVYKYPSGPFSCLWKIVPDQVRVYPFKYPDLFSNKNFCDIDEAGYPGVTSNHCTTSSLFSYSNMIQEYSDPALLQKNFSENIDVQKNYRDLINQQRLSRADSAASACTAAGFNKLNEVDMSCTQIKLDLPANCNNCRDSDELDLKSALVKMINSSAKSIEESGAAVETATRADQGRTLADAQAEAEQMKDNPDDDDEAAADPVVEDAVPVDDEETTTTSTTSNPHFGRDGGSLYSGLITTSAKNNVDGNITNEVTYKDWCLYRIDTGTVPIYIPFFAQAHINYYTIVPIGDEAAVIDQQMLGNFFNPDTRQQFVEQDVRQQNVLNVQGVDSLLGGVTVQLPLGKPITDILIQQETLYADDTELHEKFENCSSVTSYLEDRCGYY